jgi:endonuclease III
MKNATLYEKKVKKLLGPLGKSSLPDQNDPPVRVMLRAILLSDSTRASAENALRELEEEFVDYNELRVAPPKEIVDYMGRDHVFAREKAESMTKALNAIFARTSNVSIDYMRSMPKRDLRKHLLEIGLSPFAAAYVLMTLFGGHAVPVDASTMDALEIEGCIHPGSSVEDVQGFLERIVNQKDGYAAYEALRKLVDKHSKALSKKRQDRIDARNRQAAEEEAARQAAEEAAKAKAKAKPPEPAAQAPRKNAKNAKGAKPKTRNRKKS